MKRLRLPLLLVLAAAVPGAADGDFSVIDLINGTDAPARKAVAPQLDPKRIINESSSFLKEREPEMTAEEYALYEQVVTMLTTNVNFALKMLEAMMNEKEPPSPAFEFILGNTYYAANQPERAEQSYRHALARYPNFVRAWNNLGVLYYSHNRYADAIPCFSKSVSLGDRDPMTFGLLGFCLEHEGDIMSAEVAYTQALAADRTNPDWKEGLLRIFVDGKQYGRAEPLVKNLLKVHPTEKRLWLTYAGVLVAEGQKLEAIVALETAAGTGLAGADELLALGDLYAEQGLSAEAVAVYTKALNPARDQSVQRLLRFAQMLTATDQLTEAEQALAAIKEDLSPSARLALLQCRADLAIARKHWPEARAEAEVLLKLAPLNGNALLTLGRASAEEHDYARAMLAFESAYRVPECTYRASLELAGLEMRNRRFTKSVEYLERALSIRKTDSVEDYLARVKSLVPADGNSG